MVRARSTSDRHATNAYLTRRALDVVGGLEVRCFRPHVGDRFAGDDAPEPVAFDLGHVPDQSEQRECRRWHRAAFQVAVVEAVALPGQRRTVMIEPPAQCLSL